MWNGTAETFEAEPGQQEDEAEHDGRLDRLWPPRAMRTKLTVPVKPVDQR